VSLGAYPKIVLLVLFAAMAAAGQSTADPPTRKWFVVAEGPTATKIEVADITLPGRSGVRSALVRIRRGIPENYAEVVTAFDCGRRMISAQTTTIYRPDDPTPVEVRNPKEPYRRVRRNSPNEKALDFVCAMKIT
jgi:hypothetical protein